MTMDPRMFPRFIPSKRGFVRRDMVDPRTFPRSVTAGRGSGCVMRGGAYDERDPRVSIWGAVPRAGRMPVPHQN